MQRSSVAVFLVNQGQLLVQDCTHSRQSERVDTNRSHTDPRLKDLNFVRTLALRRYVRNCAEARAIQLERPILPRVARVPLGLRSHLSSDRHTSTLLCKQGTDTLGLSGLHDVCVAAHAFVQEKRAHADVNDAAQSCVRKRVVLNGEIRLAVAQLIVCLWRVACITPFFLSDKKTTDSFRPFSSGVIYSLKRGLAHSKSGMCLIPDIPHLAQYLPVMRSSQTSTVAKQLHSSSHRGICSLHRALTSIEDLENDDDRAQVELLLIQASNQAGHLKEVVARSLGSVS